MTFSDPSISKMKAFDPDFYESQLAVEAFEMPSEIRLRLTPEANTLISRHGCIKFKLDTYPGTDNESTTINYDDSNVYVGQHTVDVGKSVRQGKGYLMKNKNVYAGYFNGDKFEGPGTLIYHDDEETYHYFGYWKNDVLNSKGVVHYLSGYIYRGDFQDNIPHGCGEERWPDNSTYKGDFKQGYKWGHGELKWPDKACYIGQFKEGYFDGDGVFEWYHGNKYEGSWKENEMHGKGIFKWADGMVYEGGYVMGKKEGKGVLVWPNGSRWEGTWLGGKRSSEGMFFNDQGEQVPSLSGANTKRF